MSAETSTARTLLLADDSPTIRKIVELTFSDTGIRVEAVSTGQEALARLAELRPDLVLADVVMPEPSGYEICRAVKASDRPIPVILLAGTFEPFDHELAKACGADALLVKPFESRALRERVERLLREPVRLSAPPPDSAAPEPQPVQVAVAPEAAPATGPAPLAVSPELVEAVARAVVARLAEHVLREIAWEVVPDLAGKIIRERIRELESTDADPA